LHRLFEHADRIAAIHIVIQYEVGVRIVAQPGRRDYGYLSVASQWYGNPEIAFRIPPEVFNPPPKVDSALVSFHMPGERAKINVLNEIAFLEFVKECFAQKRKTLRNNLRPRLGPKTEAVLKAANLPADVRAEQLTIPQFATLFQLVQ
jgi:16S rRNA (adenine1518-N6/adenine1519-N6)-dimethyltransferase